MKNLLNFIKKYGNKDFDELSFNEVDGLILSQISYMNIDNFVPKYNENKGDVSLINVLKKLQIEEACNNTLDRKRNHKLIKALKKSSRYDGLKINYFVNKLDDIEIKQFCAMTFIFKGFMFIAYRGTDVTLLGWKEDLMMAYLDAIPSQIEALEYIKKISSIRTIPFYLGGHSKGGNLAVYAAYYAPKEIKDRIIHIYNYDGPGFIDNLYNTIEMEELKNKLTSYSCKEAIVGTLLFQDPRLIFVKTKGISIFQHDPYNWGIKKSGTFKLIKRPTSFSKAFAKTTNEFINLTSLDERKDFVEIFFKLSMENNYYTVLDLAKRPIGFIYKMFKNYKCLTEKEHLFFQKMLKMYKKLFINNFKIFARKKKEK